MNALSLAYSNAQKQTSWIDDPFELKGFVTGVTTLNHTRNLTDYMMDLVGQYGKHSSDHIELSLEMLPESEQDELVRLYIESIDREIEWACYGDDESINSEFLCAMLSMLKDNNEETRAHFAETTRKNLIIYYTKPLNELFDSACDTYFHMMMNESGYFAHVDREHGDLVWSKY